MKLDDSDRKHFERNVKINYAMGGLMWSRFFIPVLALFYIASKVPLEQFAVIMAVFAFVTMILEVPTGVIADLLGKKKTLLIARSMYVLEIIIIAFFNGFWPFLIAKVISGIGVSLSSGTDSALLYDTLKRLGKEKDYKKISGIASFISNISMAFVFIIGAFLFTINPKLPAYVSLPFITFGFLLTFLLKEPYGPHKHLTFSNSFKHLKEGIVEFLGHDYLKYLFLFSLPVGTAISIFLSLSSAYFKEILIPVSLIGAISFIGSLTTAYSAKRAHFVEEKLGERKFLMLLQILTVLSIMLVALMVPYFGFLFYFIIAFISGVFGIVVSDYVNRRIKTSHRATMLSINNMSDNIGIAVLFPIAGYLAKSESMQFSFTSLGIFFLLYFLALYFYYRKVFKK